MAGREAIYVVWKNHGQMSEEKDSGVQERQLLRWLSYWTVGK